MRKLIFLFLLGFGVKLTAQQNAVFRYPSVHYQRGVELFDEKKFNAAITQFQLFIQSNPGPGEYAEADYYMAMSKLYAGHADGETSVLHFVEKNPGSHKTHMANLALGDYYYLNRKFSTALSYYKQVDPLAIANQDKDRFYFRKGYSQVATRKYKDAAETLRPLTEKENEFRTLATYYYAYCSYYTGNYTEALRAFQEIEADGPKYVRLYIAQIYYLQGQYEKALMAADKITSGVPKSRVQFLKGKCQYRLGKYELAADAYNQSAMSSDSLDRNEIYEFGYSNYKAGNYTKAGEWLKMVSYQGDSLSQLASYNLADCFLRLKSKRDAMNAFAEAYRAAYDKKVAEQALFNQAKLAVELGESNAGTLLQKFVDNYPSSPDAKEAKKLLARLMLNTDNYRDAVAVLESIGDLDAQTEESYQRVTLARGMELFKSRQWNEAIALFDKCMQRRANRSLAGQAAFWKGESQMQMEIWAEAAANYQKFLDADGTEDLDYAPYAYYGLGYARYKQERFADAVSYFDKYARTATRGRYDEKVYNDAQLRLGDCNLRLGMNKSSSTDQQLENALKAYAYVTGKRGADADYALFQSGMINGLQEKREKKIVTMKRLTTDYPGSRYMADAYFQLGSEYFFSGNNREAEKYCKLVIDDFKGNPLVANCYNILGRMYRNEGKNDKAIEMYTRLYDEFPGTPEARGAADNVKTIYASTGRAEEYENWAAKRGGISSSELDSLMYNSAFTYFEKDEYKNAITSFEKYLNKMRNGQRVVDAHYYKALCHEELNESKQAMEDYKYVADANGSPFQEDAVLRLLRLYGPDGPCEDLVVYLEKIEKLTKTRDTKYKAWRALLRCYDKLGKLTDARDVATRVGNELSSPDELKAEALVYLGKADFNERKYRSAMDRFAEVYTRYNNQYAAEAKYREALVYYTLDSLEACKNSCYDVLDQFNSYDFWVGKAMLLLGDAFLKGGDEFSAKATWNSVVENFSIPEIANEAKEKLAKLKNKKATNNIIDE
ncbi:MAG: tetratricopeptide repeat protein [Bacteroidetes bacterium]|nr:tetratricopeptide repeat protein [Bacteroidota bacterium]